MKLVLNQYEIKKAIELYVATTTKLKTKTFPTILIVKDKISAEVELAEVGK